MNAPHEDERFLRWRSIALVIWAVIGGALVLWGIAVVLGRISSALVPFLLAFLIVFLLRGPVQALVRRGWNRSLAVGAWFLLGIAVIVLLSFVVGPVVVKQLSDFAEQVPTYLQSGQVTLAEWQARFSDVVIPNWLRTAASSFASQLGGFVSQLGESAARIVVSAGGGVATFVVDIFLALVISYWILKDLPKLRREIQLLAGKDLEDDLENLLATLSRVVGGYLKGQTIASAATGVIAGIGLGIAGVPYALVLGILAFILNYIPYVGPVVVGLIAATVALFDGGLVLALISLAIVVGSQILVDQLLTPRVMSEQVSLHPTIVIFSLLVGGTLFGFFGLLMAIPVAAMINGLFVYYWQRKTNVMLATEDGALFRVKDAECAEDEECDTDDSNDDVETPEGTAT